MDGITSGISSGITSGISAQIPANGNAHLPAERRNYSASSDQGSEISSRSVFSTKSDVETEKMNTAARRNRFYAKRRTERMKRRGFEQKSGSSYYLCVDAGLRSNLRRFAILIPEVESPDGRILRSIGEREYGRSAASRMGPDVDNRVEGFDPTRAC